MSEGSEIVCFHCGQKVGDPPRLNEMPDGEPCRSCAERLLDALPPIFHAPIVVPAEADGEARSAEDRELARLEQTEEERPSSRENDQPA